MQSNFWLLVSLLFFFFFKVNSFRFLKNCFNGRKMFVCSTLLFFPSWLFSGSTSYTKHFFLAPPHYVQFSLKIYHLSEVVLNLHLYLFSSYLSLFFSSANLQLCRMITSLWPKIKSVGRCGLYPNNKWYGEHLVKLWFVQL